MEKKFHIKLEGKKLVTSHAERIPRMETTEVAARSGSAGGAAFYANTSYSPLTVHEGKRIIVDVEEFQYTYKCGHCGH